MLNVSPIFRNDYACIINSLSRSRSLSHSLSLSNKKLFLVFSLRGLYKILKVYKDLLHLKGLEVSF